MARADDITDLLTPAKDPGFGFRQATVVSFDSATGNCFINLAGALIGPMPILSEVSGVNLTAGDVVILLKSKSSFAILGRVYPAGDPKLFVGAQFAEAWSNTATTFAVPVAAGTIFTSITITPPPWSNTATITAQIVAGATNSTGGAGFLNAGTTVTGGTGLAGAGTLTGGFPSATVPAGSASQVTAIGAAKITYTQNCAPITIGASVWTGGAIWASAGSNYIVLNVNPLYSKA